ncbi:uncharacterized protein C8A04DRAFT_10125 [Dichotomopilus funicola]|uniref:Phosphoglycerate mutase n=1 Tax=Dichotomopilus funicola TaxID=1934379 RepID=A0AAN6ZNP4_9PEZI|nr:hypothetical protein C8A04DRAFT_10125 [Dichotomopilus funicola]
MGRPPAYLFVVRHGYRLDAADKQWHLSSPTPYDPPLTYSGWQQAKSLGVRIASIIRERVEEDERAAGQNSNPKPKRKKYEVVLHSSPFLRCIQTSIAISAGLAQDSTPFGPASSPTAPSESKDEATGPSKPSVVTDLRDTAASANSTIIRKSVLRLDAFLGEWLTPKYFEFITPPPESVMMLASAKADLLRREDYSHHANYVSHHHSNSTPNHQSSSSQGHLWSPIVRDSPTSPFGGSQSNGFGAPTNPSPSTSIRSDKEPRTPGPGYISPVPHYAIGNNNTIPAGYVAHARDACSIIDYQWHSTRSVLDWGDGGSFPEEWAAMHKRFRTGVQSLVDWYSTAENPTRPVTKNVRNAPVGGPEDGDEDVETESIVILVSHGAGCNALIGAITHQPVLMDVGMASLTMAVRKPDSESENTIPQKIGDLPPTHHLYDLKLFANSDHLRSPATTPSSPRPPPVSNPFNGPRSRHLSFSTSGSSFYWNDGPGNRSPSSAGLGGYRKSPKDDSPVPRLSFINSTATGGGSSGGITVGSGVTSFAATRPSLLAQARSGLWTPTGEESDEDSFGGLNFSRFDPPATVAAANAASPLATKPTATTSTTTNETAEPTLGASSSLANGAPGLTTQRSPKPEPDQLGAGSGGLWGAPRPPDDADRFRDVTASKRRWTVSERS